MSAVALERLTQEPIPFCRVEIVAEARAACERVLSEGWITTGPEVLAFEDELASCVGAAHAVAVSSCTAALELSLRALDLPPAAPVLISALTFAGAVHAVVHAGLRPVLVDVDPATLMPDAERTAAARRRSGAEAMVVLHYGGAPAPVAALAEAARLPLRRVVEDAAHALWTRVEARDVGAISMATCFSFYATKNLPIGEGGMITTDDGAMAERLRSTRLHGMSSDAWRRYLPGGSWRYDVALDGIKANMTDVAAAIGRAQLAHLPAWQRRRELVAARYLEALRDVPGISVPRVPVEGRHAWHLFVVIVDPAAGVTRDELAASLASDGIGTSVHFIPVHRLSYFRELLDACPLPGADLAGERVLSLPMHPSLSDSDVDRVCDSVRGAMTERASRAVGRSKR